MEKNTILKWVLIIVVVVIVAILLGSWASAHNWFQAVKHITAGDSKIGPELAPNLNNINALCWYHTFMHMAYAATDFRHYLNKNIDNYRPNTLTYCLQKKLSMMKNKALQGPKSRLLYSEKVPDVQIPGNNNPTWKDVALHFRGVGAMCSNESLNDAKEMFAFLSRAFTFGCLNNKITDTSGSDFNNRFCQKIGNIGYMDYMKRNPDFQIFSIISPKIQINLTSGDMRIENEVGGVIYEIEPKHNIQESLLSRVFDNGVVEDMGYEFVKLPKNPISIKNNEISIHHPNHGLKRGGKVKLFNISDFNSYPVTVPPSQTARELGVTGVQNVQFDSNRLLTDMVIRKIIDRDNYTLEHRFDGLRDNRIGGDAVTVKISKPVGMKITISQLIGNPTPTYFTIGLERGFKADFLGRTETLLIPALIDGKDIFDPNSYIWYEYRLISTGWHMPGHWVAATKVGDKWILYNDTSLTSKVIGPTLWGTNVYIGTSLQILMYQKIRQVTKHGNMKDVSYYMNRPPILPKPPSGKNIDELYKILTNPFRHLKFPEAISQATISSSISGKDGMGLDTWYQLAKADPSQLPGFYQKAREILTDYAGLIDQWYENEQQEILKNLMKK